MSLIQQAIQDVTDEFVSKGFMFTAFDVTCTVRSKVGKSMFVSHSDVKTAVQNQYNNGDFDQYVRDLVSVGANIEPWLYYHPHSYISNYDPNWIDNNPNQNGMKADISNTSASGYAPPSLDLDDDEEYETDLDADENVSDPSFSIPASSVTTVLGIPTNPFQTKVTTKLGKNEHRVTKNGRLQVPINMVRTAGLKPYQLVCVVNECSKLTIQQPSIPDTNTFSLRVNGDGRIRLSSKILTSITATPKSEIYKIESDNSEIVIHTI
jgi:bifunctional DNA-binding transcriptional regulator/antitoxin component of YhaV-PrlF toxin-antitoxin module